MFDATSDRPLQASNLEVTEVRDGIVVYQGAPERVHHLNNTAAFVFELSTGERTLEEIAEEVRLAFHLTEPPSAAVADCVGQLRRQGLVL